MVTVLTKSIIMGPLGALTARTHLPCTPSRPKDATGKVASRVVFMDAGIVVEQGPPPELFGRPESEIGAHRTDQHLAGVRPQRCDVGRATSIWHRGSR